MSDHFLANWVEIRRKIYDMLGWWYYPSLPVRSWLNNIEAYRLISSSSGYYNTRRFVSGKAFGGQNFEFTELEAVLTTEQLQQKAQGQDISDTGFEGVILRLDIDKKFLGKTVIRFDAGAFNPPRLSKLKRVGFLNNAFERRYDVYSSDAVEAHYLITPDLIERLMNFRHVLNGRAVQCAFMHGSIYVILGLDNHLIRPVETIEDGIEHISAMIHIEIGEVFLILEDIQRFLNSRELNNRRASDKDRLAYYRQENERVSQIMAQVVELWPNKKTCQHLTEHHQLVTGFWRLLLKPSF